MITAIEKIYRKNWPSRIKAALFAKFKGWLRLLREYCKIKIWYITLLILIWQSLVCVRVYLGYLKLEI
jgi:hypothetical protein